MITLAPPEKPTPFSTDFIQPFLIDHSLIRGRLVRLEGVVDAIVRLHEYPASVAVHLAEQMALAALLSATLSGKGILTVQTKGDGAVKFMVVDVMADGAMRGYARFAAEQLPPDDGGVPDLSALMGKAYLAVTLDPGGRAPRYQSIVELTGARLSEAFKSYFAQSDQAEIAVQVAVRPPEGKKTQWAAAGIIIERMPLLGGKETELTPEEQEELWQRTMMFVQTLRERELLDARITPQNLLYRLFNEDGVWVYKLHKLHAGCRCSRAKMRAALKTIAVQELLATLEGDALTMDCEFCGRKETFTRRALLRLHGPGDKASLRK